MSLTTYSNTILLIMLDNAEQESKNAKHCARGTDAWRVSPCNVERCFALSYNMGEKSFAAAGQQHTIHPALPCPALPCKYGSFQCLSCPALLCPMPYKYGSFLAPAFRPSSVGKEIAAAGGE